MKNRQKLLTDEQWPLIEPLLPKPVRRKDGRGRPAVPNRACFEGILWILQTGAAWRFLPDEFPSPATCWRRLKQWEDDGVWLDAWRALLGALDEQGLLKWDETFLDGSFAPAKKGAPYEDGRKLRRYLRRWIVERTNAWLGQFRRLLVRHEHLLSTYYAFFYLACFWITLRKCF